MNQKKAELCALMKKNGTTIETLREFERAYHRSSRTTLRLSLVLVILALFVASIFFGAWGMTDAERRHHENWREGQDEAMGLY